MNANFFKAKRRWSRYKDSILDYYLRPYIPKVARLKKPILIVDCFAGCGRFGDGEPGSPLIIAEQIKHWRSQGKVVVGEFIESDAINVQSLERSLQPYLEFATIRFGKFEDSLAELASRARTESVFLYVDPYTVKSLEFNRMKAVYDQIRQANSSVEVLMNFNVATFMRWALAAMKRADPLPADATNEDADYQADDPTERVEIVTLDAIAGGKYWQAIATNSNLSFVEKLGHFTDRYSALMRSSFNFVCSYPVKDKYEHQTPKYMLIFGTRKLDGLELMNDAMCDAREKFLGSVFRTGTLFDMTPSEELPDVAGLMTSMVQAMSVAGPMSRKQLRAEVLQDFFCRFKVAEMNKAVAELLKSRRLYSATGKTRINDKVLLSVEPFP